MTDEQVQAVMHEMPYGLYIVGSKEPEAGKVNGMMADWVMQVSFNPRLIAVAFEKDAHTLGNIRRDPDFTVNLLAQDADSMELARPFAQPYSGRKVAGRGEPESRKVHYKLDGLAYHLTEQGCPILQGAMAWLQCEARQFLEIGDHVMVVASVLDGRIEREAEPMTSSFTGWTYSG